MIEPITNEEIKEYKDKVNKKLKRNQRIKRFVYGFMFFVMAGFMFYSTIKTMQYHTLTLLGGIFVTTLLTNKFTS